MSRRNPPLTADQRIALNTLTSIAADLTPEQNQAVLAALQQLQRETAAVYRSKVKELEAELVKLKTGRA